MRFAGKKRFKFLIGVAATSLMFGSAQFGIAHTENAGVPLTITEALKSLEMDEGAKDFKYKAANITEDKAVFTDVLMTEDDITTKAKTVTLSRSPSDSKYTLTLANVEVLGGGMDFVATDFSFAYHEKLIDNKRQIAILKPDGETGFKSDLKVNNLVINFEDGQRVNLKSAAIDGFDTYGKMRFDDLRLGGIAFKASGMNFNIDKFELGGLSQFIFDKLNETIEENSEDETDTDFGEVEDLTTGVLGNGLSLFEKAEVGKFLVEGVKIAQVPTKGKPSNKAKNAFNGFTLGKIEIKNFDANHFDRMAIENIGFDAVSEGKPISFKLGELSLDGFRFAAWKLLAKAYFLPVDDSEAKKILSTKLSDVVTRGPLDITFDAFKFRGFLFSGMGGLIKIDDLSYIFKTDKNGMVSDFIMPEGGFEITVTDKKQTIGMGMAQAFEDLGMDKVKVTWGGSAHYDSVTDTVKSDDFHMTFDKFFSFRMAYKSSSNLAWMKSVTMGQVIEMLKLSIQADADIDEMDEAVEEAIAAAANAAETYKGRSGVRNTDRGVNREITEGEKLAAQEKVIELVETPKSTDFTKEIIEAYTSEEWSNFYKGIKYNYLKLSLTDLGMLKSISASEAITKGTSAAKVRENWVAEINKSNKADNPAYVKDIFVAIGNFVKNGGKIEIGLNNEKGVEFLDLWKPDTDHKALGFTVSN